MSSTCSWGHGCTLLHRNCHMQSFSQPGGHNIKVIPRNKHLSLYEKEYGKVHSRPVGWVFVGNWVGQGMLYFLVSLNSWFNLILFTDTWYSTNNIHRLHISIHTLACFSTYPRMRIAIYKCCTMTSDDVQWWRQWIFIFTHKQSTKHLVTFWVVNSPGATANSCPRES